MTTFNTHLNVGYEPIIINRVSFPITVGIGLARHKGEVFPAGISFGLSDIDNLEVSPYVKLGLRVYLFKKFNHSSLTPSFEK